MTRYAVELIVGLIVAVAVLAVLIYLGQGRDWLRGWKQGGRL